MLGALFGSAMLKTENKTQPVLCSFSDRLDLPPIYLLSKVGKKKGQVHLLYTIDGSRKERNPYRRAVCGQGQPLAKIPPMRVAKLDSLSVFIARHRKAFFCSFPAPALRTETSITY
jgi:hypothetical protein